MVGNIGVKIAFRAIHRNFLHQTSITKGAQSVVDRRQRHAFTDATGIVKQALGSDMAIHAIAHQQRRKRNTLTRRAHIGARQPFGSILDRGWCHHNACHLVLGQYKPR